MEKTFLEEIPYPVHKRMIVIDYSEFLSTRFDLVVRCHFLEKAKFNIGSAVALLYSDQYEYLRSVFGELLEIDMAMHARVVKNLKKAPREGYGFHVASRLFHNGNWSSIQAQMVEGEKLIRRFPYPVRYGGLGLAAKRFVLALIYKRKLYWRFIYWDTKPGVVQLDLSLWKEKKYEKLLERDKHEELMETKNRMIKGMGKLKYFSIDTYMGNEGLLERYLAEKGL